MLLVLDMRQGKECVGSAYTTHIYGDMSDENTYHVLGTRSVEPEPWSQSFSVELELFF